MRSIGCLLLAAITLNTAGAQENTLREVKYEVLKEVIRQNRGKVVVVDFWFNT